LGKVRIQESAGGREGKGGVDLMEVVACMTTKNGGHSGHKRVLLVAHAVNHEFLYPGAS